MLLTGFSLFEHALSELLAFNALCTAAKSACRRNVWAWTRSVLRFVPGEEAIKGMVAVQAGGWSWRSRRNRRTQLALFFGAGTQSDTAMFRSCLDHVKPLSQA